MKLKKNKRGFTLVELVVAIAILAILAGTATGATIGILNRARKTPVDSARGELQTHIMGFVGNSDYVAKLTNATGGKGGFTEFIQTTYSGEVTVAAGLLAPSTTNWSPTDHTSLGNKIRLKVIGTDGQLGESNTWAVIIYNQYYKAKVEYNAGAFKKSEVVKVTDNF